MSIRAVFKSSVIPRPPGRPRLEWDEQPHAYITLLSPLLWGSRELNQLSAVHFGSWALISQRSPPAHAHSASRFTGSIFSTLPLNRFDLRLANKGEFSLSAKRVGFSDPYTHTNTNTHKHTAKKKKKKMLHFQSILVASGKRKREGSRGSLGYKGWEIRNDCRTGMMQIRKY